MRHGHIALVFTVGALAFTARAAANVEEQDQSADKPYQAIVERNVFALKDPPPPPSTEPQKPPPPKLTLTGITTVLGKKMVFLKAPPLPAKPGEPPKGEQFFMMTEGGPEDGDLKVVKIDEVAGSVDVVYAGTPVSLNFTDNGAKPAPGAPMPAGGIPMPGQGMPGINPQGGQPGGAIPMPTRTLRLPTPGGASPGTGTTSPGYSSYSPPTQNAAGNVMTYSAMGTPMAQPVGLGANTANPVTQVNPIQQQLPVEQQMIMIEAERERTKAAVAAGLLPPMPPTPLSQASGATAGQNQAMPMPVPGQRMLPRPPGRPALPQ